MNSKAEGYFGHELGCDCVICEELSDRDLSRKIAAAEWNKLLDDLKRTTVSLQVAENKVWVLEAELKEQKAKCNIYKCMERKDLRLRIEQLEYQLNQTLDANSFLNTTLNAENDRLERSTQLEEQNTKLKEHVEMLQKNIGELSNSLGEDAAFWKAQANTYKNALHRVSLSMQTYSRSTSDICAEIARVLNSKD